MTTPVVTNNTNKNFKGQLADEEVICFTRKHWLLTVPYFLTLFILVISPLVLAVILDKKSIAEVVGQGGVFTIAGLYGLVVTYLIHLSFIRIFNFYLRILIVTNHRIIDLRKTLFIHDRRAVILLSEIQDISMRKDGVFQTIFNFGSLDIMISGSSQTITLGLIPNPTYHLTKIIKSRQEYIQRLAGVLPSHLPAAGLILPHEPVDSEPLVIPSYTV